MFGDNAVTQAVAEMQVRLDGLDAEKIARLEANAELDHGDWFALGDMASRALMDGTIDADTAQSLHVIHRAYNSTATLAERMVFMQVASELLSARLGAR
jgi:hypothetical protein